MRTQEQQIMLAILEIKAPLLVVAILLSTLTGCVSENNQAIDFELGLLQHNNEIGSSNIRLSDDFNGYPVIINFWYPSCPPCREETDILEAVYNEYKDQDLMIIGIQSLVLDSIEDGKDFVNEFGVSYPVGADIGSDIQLKYQVIGFPTTFFLNKDHQIIRKWSGLLDNEQLQQFVLEILE